MPALICDPRPEAAALAAEYEALHEAGESLALVWPRVDLPDGTQHFILLAHPGALYHAWENGRIAVLRNAAGLPLDEFERWLVIGDPRGDAELACARSLLAAGAEAVELLPPGEARELAQSWRSGRRTASRILRPE